MQELFDKLEVVYSAQMELQSFYLEQVAKKDTVKSGINGLWYNFEIKFIYDYFKVNNINKAKQHCYTCGLLDEYVINKFDSRILDYGIDHISYALLSDNKELIQRYANLSHKHYIELVKKGHSTPMYAIQCIIKEDWEQLQWSLDIINNKMLISKKNKWVLPDRNFYEGILNKDKEQVKKALEQLIKDHKKRNKHSELINEFISHPALGYAKLAWLKGIEVEIDSPLVPKELLPVKPLDNYEVAYDFLKNVD